MGGHSFFSAFILLVIYCILNCVAVVCEVLWFAHKSLRLYFVLLVNGMQQIIARHSDFKNFYYSICVDVYFGEIVWYHVSIPSKNISIPHKIYHMHIFFFLL